MIEAGFGPGMGKIDEEDETEDDKEGGADEGDVVSPKDEEWIGDGKGEGEEDEPEKSLGTPPAGEDE